MFFECASKLIRKESIQVHLLVLIDVSYGLPFSAWMRGIMVALSKQISDIEKARHVRWDF